MTFTEKLRLAHKFPGAEINNKISRQHAFCSRVQQRRRLQSSPSKKRQASFTVIWSKMHWNESCTVWHKKVEMSQNTPRARHVCTCIYMLESRDSREVAYRVTCFVLFVYIVISYICTRKAFFITHLPLLDRVKTYENCIVVYQQTFPKK